MRNPVVARGLVLVSALALVATVACEPVKKKAPPRLPPPPGGLTVLVEHVDPNTEGSLAMRVTCTFDSHPAFDAEWEIAYGTSASVIDLGEGTVCDLEVAQNGGMPPVTIDPEPPVTIVAGPQTTITITVEA